MPPSPITTIFTLVITQSITAISYFHQRKIGVADETNPVELSLSFNELRHSWYDCRQERKNLYRENKSQRAHPGVDIRASSENLLEMLSLLRRGLVPQTALYPVVELGANMLQMVSPASRNLSYPSFINDDMDPRPQFQKYRGEKQHDPVHRRSLNDSEKREMYSLYRDPQNPASVDYLSQR